MPNICNEEIRAIQHTLIALRKGVVLESDSSRRNEMKQDIKELENLLEVKLNETSDFCDVKIGEDSY